ncbi:MAG TPA: hypothetical protein VLM87_10310, partial [Rubrivivax sp.]|nr:hypothetical protein [Rubrivivax sp.]
MNWNRLIPTAGALAATVWLTACTTPPAPPADEPAIEPPAALHLEGLPPVPQRLLAPIQRWTAVSGHAFVDWHPSRREMLV